MKKWWKQALAAMLVFAAVLSMIPAVSAQADDGIETVLSEQAYAAADDVFEQIREMEDAPARKNATEEELADSAAALVRLSESYEDGSLERNGNCFTWETTDGIRCVYSPRMREIQENMQAPEAAEEEGIYNEPVATKGGWPSGNQVYLVAPYYGLDSSFTDQYKNEARDIAAAIGDTDGYTLYSGRAATVDKVAEAVSNGAVVIFDSHGNTDYERGYDYVTGATSSYLCLSSTTGLTNADYDDGALYDSEGIWINGATIANHMTKNSPGGLLWMAICLGMATDTMCEPLREKGVEVVYGYSQSVTFDGDYLWEEIFWDSMCKGETVATAIADMKDKCGEWDYCTKMYNYAGWREDEYGPITSLYEARSYYYAFPVVVSDEDAHPGQRNGNSFYGADSLQTVKSTYTLFSQYEVTASSNTAWGTVSVSGSTITATPATGYFAESATLVSGTATISQNGNTFSVIAESDCVIQINFAKKTSVTVQFSGADVAAQTGYAGDSMTLPTAEAPDGYNFVGWTTAPLSEETTEKPSFYTNSFIPTENTTLYALYSYVDESDNTGTGDYVKVTQTPADWSGEYVIVYEDAGYIFDSSLSKLDAVSNYQQVTITNETISAQEAEPYKFIIEAAQGGYSIRSAGGSYIGWNTDANGLSAGSGAMVNTISLSASGDANIVGTAGAHLRFNATSGQYRFRYYKAATYTNQKPIALYVKDGSVGTTWYTSSVITCEHANGYNETVTPSTCVTEGMTLYTCVDCGYSYSEPVAVVDHSYGDWIEEEDCTSRTCTVCGDEQIGMEITKQPKTVYAANGKSAKTTVTVEGEDLKYQWYVKNAGASSYTRSSNKTATYSCKMSSTSKDRYVKCKITDQYGNSLWTKTVRLRMKATVVSQPAAKTVVAGKTAKFSVEAMGSGITYQWQYRTSSSGSWKNVSAASGKTATYSVKTEARHHGYQYRCRITDSAGNRVYTKAVSLYVLGIKTQPTSKSVKVGATAKFTVSAVGKGLTYQWQYRTSSSGSWKNVSASSGKKAAYSLTAASRHNGYQYRCRITDSAGNVIYSNVVKLTVKK